MAADGVFSALHPLAPPEHLGEFEEFEEHGGKWLSCVACGAQWSIVECQSAAGEDYQDLEQVAEGDGYCADRNSLVNDACEAQEVFDADELEAWADRENQKSS
jgi:hypothetical protein